jgi:glycosyltransferase involved in cell wall biosynthesis
VRNQLHVERPSGIPLGYDVALPRAHGHAREKIRRPDFGRMDTLDIVALCERLSGGRPLILAMPPPIGVIDTDKLMGSNAVAGVIWPRREQVPVDAPAERCGWFLVPAYDWVLPAFKSDHLLFLGPRRSLVAKLLFTAFAAGVRRVTYAGPLGWCSNSLARELGLRIRGRAQRAMVHHIPALLTAIETRLQKVFDDFITTAQDMGRAHMVDAAPERILFVNNALSVGGAERQLVNTMIGLKARGYDDLVLLCERHPELYGSDIFSRQLSKHQLAIEQLPGVPLSSPPDQVVELDNKLRSQVDRWPQMLLDDVMFLSEVLQRRQPLVIHAWLDSTNIMAGLAGILMGVPRILLSTRNVAPVHFSTWAPWMLPAYRALARHPSVVFVNNSAAGAKDYARWLALPVERFHIVPNGLNEDALLPPDRQAVADFRQQHRIGPDARVVGSIFRLFDEKNPKLWLQVAAAVVRVHPDIHFLLVGSGPLLPAAQQFARKLGIESRVIFVGELADPRPALAVMDVFLLASRAEGLPNVLIEAQAQGVPVVTTAAGGAAEAIEPGQTGLVVSDMDPAPLAKAVLHALDDAAWADSARARAPVFAAANFGLKSMVDRTLGLYGLPAPRPPLETSNSHASQSGMLEL